MGNMEFHYANFVNTTTLITCGSGSTTFGNLFDRKSSTQWVTSGFNNDTTSTVLSVEFPSSKNITTIVLENINLKDVQVYYNSNTANKFSMTTATEGTQTSFWDANSATYLYLDFATTSVDSIQVVASSTIDANEEKKIGELWILEKDLRLTYNPSSKQYMTNFKRKEYVHQMSDGGFATYILSDRFQADIKLNFVSESERDNLRDIHLNWKPYVFIPAPTGTSWDKQIFEVNWIGTFDFLVYADNYRDNGYVGTIRLKESSK